MPINPRTIAVLLSACALAGVGCGDDDDDSGDSGGDGDAAAQEQTQEQGGGGANTRLAIAAAPSGDLSFDKTSLRAPAGKVTIVMDNPSEVPHAVEIEGMGVEEEGKTVTKGGVSRASADLQPGKYTFYCPVGNHEAAGMKGTLTVR